MLCSRRKFADLTHIDYNDRIQLTTTRRNHGRRSLIFSVNNLLNKVLISVCLLSSINLTEINTQDQFVPKSMLFLEKFKFSAEANNVSRNQTSKSSTNKTKISPTRIIINNVNLHNYNRSNNDAGRKSRADTDNILMNSIVSFSHLKPKLVKQMAPAYELWPNLNDNINVISSLKKSKSESCSLPSEKTTSDTDNLPPLHGNLRNLLPKPVTILPSATIKRIVTVRSVMPDKKVDHNTETTKQTSNKHEDEDETDDAQESEEGTVSNEPESLSQRLEARTDDETYVEDTAGNPINFKAFEDGRVMERAESQKLSYSPVYPPGDLERLYSDALLVYVKDFNQYIKK